MKLLESYDTKDEPLVTLECGHSFTLSSLDGTVALESVYAKNKESVWVAPKELPAKLGSIPHCPHCREPICNIRSYPFIFILLLIFIIDVNKIWAYSRTLSNGASINQV